MALQLKKKLYRPYNCIARLIYGYVSTIIISFYEALIPKHKIYLNSMVHIFHTS